MKRILIVDHDLNISRSIKNVLQSINYYVKIVSSLNNLYPAVYNFNPGIILMDSHPFGIDGPAISREVKDFSPSSPRVILYSSSSYFKENWFGAEVDDFLINPLDTAELLSKINKVDNYYSCINNRDHDQMRMVG